MKNIQSYILNQLRDENIYLILRIFDIMDATIWLQEDLNLRKSTLVHYAY